jgi:cytoskeletal protein CcmA (bactofilin family)
VAATPAPAASAHGASAGGRTLLVKGELKASEDLTIDGQVEGRVELLQHVLTVGATARVRAEIVARVVVVDGEVVGNITASERVEIRSSKGHVEGDIFSPRVAIADGARFKGRIDMSAQPSAARPAGAPARQAEPAAAASAR